MAATTMSESLPGIEHLTVSGPFTRWRFGLVGPVAYEIAKIDGGYRQELATQARQFHTPARLLQWHRSAPLGRRWPSPVA